MLSLKLTSTEPSLISKETAYFFAYYAKLLISINCDIVLRTWIAF